MCGFPFTASGYLDLFTGLEEISAPQWAGRVPKGLPVQRVDLKLYPGMRHEVLNENGKGQVYEDVLQWLNTVV